MREKIEKEMTNFFERNGERRYKTVCLLSIYVENLEESTINLLELVSDYSKVPRYKVHL